MANSPTTVPATTPANTSTTSSQKAAAPSVPATPPVQSYAAAAGTSTAIDSKNSGTDKVTIAEAASMTDDGNLFESSSFSLLSEKFLTPKSNSFEKNTFFVDTLRGKFTELSKPNLFKIQFNINSSIQLPNNLEQCQYLLKSVSLPTVTVGKITVPWRGTTYQFPGDITYDDISLTFWNDDQMAVRKFFSKWLHKYVSNSMDSRSAIPNTNMMNSLTIQQYDNDFKLVLSVELYHIYPTSISEVQLSHDNTDTRSETVVTFTYSNAVTYDGTSGGSSSGSSNKNNNSSQSPGSGNKLTNPSSDSSEDGTSGDSINSNNNLPSAGVQGSQDNWGFPDDGSQGYQDDGSQGYQDDGSQGYQDDGSQGYQDDGYQGVVGSQTDIGIQGSQGPQSVQGPQDNWGSQGASVGTQAPQGPQQIELTDEQKNEIYDVYDTQRQVLKDDYNKEVNSINSSYDAKIAALTDNNIKAKTEAERTEKIANLTKELETSKQTIYHDEQVTLQQATAPL